jgi:predicted small lipoprotein YifL
MNIRKLIRPGKPILMAVLCALLLLGLGHCGQKGGLTRPEQAATASR